MRKETKQKIDSMKMTDIYSLILFAIFRLSGVPEYSSLSELSYILDGKSFFNFLEYFGGTTIKVPTKEEFKVVVDSLLLYQFINIEGIEYSQAIKLCECDKNKLAEVTECYSKLVNILKDYNIGGTTNE